MYRQFKLKNDLGGCTEFMTVWLEQDSRLKTGTRLTLKEDSDNRLWTVMQAYDTLLPTRPDSVQWNVGGVNVARRRK